MVLSMALVVSRMNVSRVLFSAEVVVLTQPKTSWLILRFSARMAEFVVFAQAFDASSSARTTARSAS